jgi:hypothetical protein
MPKPAPKALLGSSWTSVQDARSACERAQSIRRQQNENIGRLNNRIDAHRESLVGSLRGIPAAERARVIQQSISGRRRELAEESRALRLAFTRQLAEIAGRAREAEQHYGSVVAHLMRRTLGSEMRSRYAQQIERSGPAELKSMAELAAATRNEDLAAALIGRVSELKPNDRPFAGRDLAEHLVGEELREVRLALARAQLASMEGLDADTRFETGKTNAHRRMELAILRKRIAEEFDFGTEDEPQEDEDASEEETAEA